MGLLAEAASYSWSGASVGWAAIMYGPVLLGTVLLHELGHCLATWQAGGHADGILLWPLGGRAYIAHASGLKGKKEPCVILSLLQPLQRHSS
jgi:Zn-dependent protease